MDETQTQKLLEFGKKKLESIILGDYISIKSALESLNKNGDDISSLNKLKEHVNRYKQFSKEFKEVYGVEFKDIQEWYDVSSSDINKYLQMNNN